MCKENSIYMKAFHPCIIINTFLPTFCKHLELNDKLYKRRHRAHFASCKIPLQLFMKNFCKSTSFISLLSTKHQDKAVCIKNEHEIYIPAMSQ